MASSGCDLFFKAAASRTLFAIYSRSLTSTAAIFAGSKWRYDQGKAENNSSYGPLTDLPDYTYLDGRPTELSTCQTRRQQKRIALASRVMLLISEMKQGQENYQYRLGLAEKERKEIVQKRLKPKPRYTFKKN